MVEEVREIAPPHRFAALDSWRGICAILVTLFHFPLMGGVVFASPLVRNSYLFVDFFFVLSGFVMMATQADKLKRPGGRWRYLVKRLGKLWPLHVAMLTVFVAVSVAGGGLGRDERHSLGAIWTNLLLLHGLGLHHDLTWNPPSWSISVEWLLYLMFAAVAPRTWRNWAFGALIVLSLALLVLKAPLGMNSSYDYGAFRGLAGFSVGALLAQIPRRSFGTMAEVAVVALVGSFVWSGLLTYAAPFVFAVAVFVFAGSRGVLGRLLTTRVPIALGHWSYSIYMLQAAFVALLWALADRMGWTRQGEFLDAGAASDLVAVVYALGIIALASRSYSWFEEPIRQRVARWADQRRAQPGAALP